AQLYSQHFPPGHLLNRAFVLKYAPGAQIGLGAFGFVITGRHRRLGYEVAVKFIQINKVPRWGWSDDPDLGRVPTEAALLKLLDHPGIIKFLDLFQDQEYFYLVQELHGSPWRATLSQSLDYSRHTASSLCFQDLCGGSELTMPSYPPAASPSFSSPPCSPVTPVTPSSPVTPLLGVRPNMGRRQSHDLFECIEEHQCLSEFQARYIFAQVVDAVHYLDSVGVAHRDIKDENVLIDRDFRVKLIDFGAASCVDIQTGPRPWYRHFRGTVAYAPAEVIRNVKYHRAEPADVWALGVLLSYLITGRSAFPTAAEAAQGRIHLQKCRENTVSAECWDLLTRCLDPDPSRRAPIAEIKAHVWLEGALDKA
ncbi:Pkinase-domain-containing protein, partial [Ramaria rubella]